MTAKRDLKRRIRARQARTGETYTTARRHVLAARDDATAPRTPIDVAEVIDLSEPARELGYACNVVVYPTVADAADLAQVLVAVRTALSIAGADVPTALLRDLVLRGIAPRHHRVTRDPEFLARARAGLTSVSSDGRVLAVHVQGRTQMVTVLAAVWRATPTLVLMSLDDTMSRLLAPPLRAVQLLPTSTPTLFLIFNGQRHRITREPFVIGRHPSSNLQIRDGHVSRKHAAVLWRHGAHYIADLGSHAGIEYRGMKIDNKRIEEGDLFRIHDYVVRFTFFETDG